VQGPVTTAQTIGSSFARFVSTPQNTLNPAISLDNLNCRLSVASGSTLNVQLSAVSGSYTAYTTGYYNRSGSNITGFTDSSGVTYTAGTWTTVGGLTVQLLVGGDMVEVYVTDVTNNRTYRVIYIHGQPSNGGFISIERLA
jgi:hypothetical protein